MEAPVIDFVNTVDWVFPCAGPPVSRFLELFPTTRSSPVVPMEDHGLHTAFLAAPCPLALAPTRLQFVELCPIPSPDVQGSLEADTECSVPPLAEIVRLQSPRQQKIHGTLFAVDDFPAALEWLRHQNVPLFVEPPCPHLTFPRAWIGWTPDGSAHVPGHDPGIFVELISSESHHDRVRAASVAELSPAENPNWRVGGRTFLVHDLRKGAAQLLATLGIEPLGPSRADPLLNANSLTFGFRHPGGARLTLAEAKTDGFARRFGEEFGPGLISTLLVMPDAEYVAARIQTLGATGLVRDEGRFLVRDDLLPGVILEIARP